MDARVHRYGNAVCHETVTANVCHRAFCVCVTADLLHRFHGWGVASSVIAHSSIPAINLMNQAR